MMGGKLWFFAVLILSVLFVSGCDSFNYGKGIVINDFSFIPPLVEAGQPVYLTAEFQNQGQFLAEDVYLYVYGLRDEWKKVSGDDISSGISVGDIESPLIEGSRLVNQGEVKYYDWMFSSPSDIRANDARINTMWARVCYSYKTLAKAKIKLVSSHEWSSRSRQEKIDLKVSKGPVDIKIESMQPVVVLPETKGFSNLRVSIDNVGGGNFVSDSFACSSLNSVTDEDLNVIKSVKVRLDGSETLCEFDSEIFLRRGDSQVFTINCQELDLMGFPEKEIDLEIEFRYNYYVDSEADVSVKGVDR